MKRFYDDARIREENGGFAVFLDDRRLKSPAKREIVLPTRLIADAIAEEWRAQEKVVVPAEMPMMQLAATAVDRVARDEEVIARDAAGYGLSDLLFYRADMPVELSLRQAEEWQPIVDWAADRFSVEFTVTAGLMPVDQPSEAEEAFLRAASGFSTFELTPFHVMTTITGSFLLALAVAERHVDAARAFELSRMDEAYQAELWGVDEEAEARRRRLSNDMTDAERFLDLVRGN